MAPGEATADADCLGCTASICDGATLRGNGDDELLAKDAEE